MLAKERLGIRGPSKEMRASDEGACSIAETATGGTHVAAFFVSRCRPGSSGECFCTDLPAALEGSADELYRVATLTVSEQTESSTTSAHQRAHPPVS